MPQITFLHPHYSIGSIAIRDIKADHDFLVEDKAATEQGRLEASRSIEPAFDFDQTMPEEITKKITSAFLIMEDTLIHLARLTEL